MAKGMKEIQTWYTQYNIRDRTYHVHRVTNGYKEDYSKYLSPSGMNRKANRLKAKYPDYKIVRLGLKKKKKK